MKLSIAFLLTFVFTLQVSKAQEGFRIGPTATYLFSKPSQIDSVPNEFNFRYKSGFNGGVSMFYGFTKRFGIAANVLYTSKGYRLFNDSNSHGTAIKSHQTFLEFPIYAVFRQRFNNVSFIRENVGFSLSSQLSRTNSTHSNSNGTFRIEETTKNSFYPMFMLGVEVCNENKAGNVFILGVNFKQGFTNNMVMGVYNNKTSITPYFNLGFKGGYLGISLTYQFNLKNLKKEEEFFY